MRPGRTQSTGLNLYRHEISAAIYMKSGQNVWCLVSGRIDHFTVVAKLPGLRMETRPPVTLF